LCTGATFARGRTTVLSCGRQGCGCTAEHEGLLCLRDLPNVVRDAGGELNVFLMHQSFISLALLIATTLVAGFFAYIHSIKRQTYLLLWTAAWAVFALHYVGPALAPSTAASPLQSALDHWLFALSGVLFFLGAQLYSQRKPWKIPGLVVGVLFGLWTAANATDAISVSAVIPASLLYIAVAVVFWQESRRQETLADRLLGVSFASWGVLWIALYILKATPELQGAGMSVVAAAPCAFVAMLMVMALYEEEKRRIERNMLALSNLNLATSSFVGGEIQRMLSQALDRVLGVVRLPAGALFLHHGDPQGPTSVVAVGLSDEFAAPPRTKVWTIISSTWFRVSAACWDFATCATTPSRRSKKNSPSAGSANWRSRRDCAAWWPLVFKPKSKPSACCFSGHRTAGASRPRSCGFSSRSATRSAWQWRTAT